ncbi:hypothetical protein [Sphingobium chlorophenolicum]|uniref:Uncharacterized protein n=1 Tax=Sphingobium chlorophenolicum TaxID=46429 RepID=A0A081RFJ5_SPHCR|nr:hypothetical protein [Sphingobium chlorophenolicum]KEQ53968.1 hypothetical protein BV95_01656 [Sphingobium chlorophenolicum]
MPQPSPAYSIRIEPAATGMARIPTIIHLGPLAPLLADLLADKPDAKARLEAADALIRKPAKPLPADEFGGL